MTTALGILAGTIVAALAGALGVTMEQVKSLQEAVAATANTAHAATTMVGVYATLLETLTARVAALEAGQAEEVTP